jgi:uncharacterized protein (DUF2147 family)
MVRKLIITAAMLAGFSAGAIAAEPIEGDWKRPTGTIVTFKPCGGAFCAVAKTGPHAGGQAGSMSGTGKKYTGSLTDLDTGKKYTGKAAVNGNTMRLSGCVLGGLICKTETWVRQ